MFDGRRLWKMPLSKGIMNSRRFISRNGIWRLPTQMTRHFPGIHLLEIPLKCTSKWHQASINHQIGCSFWGFYCPYKIFDKMFRNILSLVPNRSFSSLSGTLAENGNLSWASSEKTAFTVPALWIRVSLVQRFIRIKHFTLNLLHTLPMIWGGSLLIQSHMEINLKIFRNILSNIL